MADPIVIFGCGPMGLLCAWAAEQTGFNPIIISHKRKSVIPGSQYLHGPIPGVTAVYPEGTVQYVRLGTAEGYAEKVYGDKAQETGWSNYLQIEPSWNVVKMYDWLWDRYEGVINDETILWEDVDRILSYERPVISTLPQKLLCTGVHEFIGTPYYIKTLETPAIDAHHDLVIYNGLASDPWYRWSILGGVCSIEATRDIWMGDPTVIYGEKAISNNCNCFPEVHRIGRWAEWRHGVLLHESYQRAVLLLEGLR